MSRINLKKFVLAAFFAAIAVVGSMFSFPVFGAKCAPVQHLVNILGAIFLGPGYAVLSAFVASFIRNILSLGSPLAFSGSMCGAFLAGILYKYGKKLWFAYAGEVFGTAIIGGIMSYPIALLVMGNNTAAIFTFVFPFFVSTCGGTVIAMVLTIAMKKSGVLDYLKQQIDTDAGYNKLEKVNDKIR